MFRIIFCFVGLAAASALFCGNVQAREFADIYTDCGLGALIAPHNDAVAAVTNVTFDSGTTAISSNISSPGTCRGGQARTAALIYTDYPEIETAVAAGRGESLDALYGMAGCSADARSALTQSLRRGFSKVVGQAAYSQSDRRAKAEQFYNLFYQTVDSQPTANACSSVS